MKLVAYKLKDTHSKNKHAFKQMCTDLGHSYSEINELKDLDQDTDIIWSPMIMFDPRNIPEKTKIFFGPQFFIFPNPSHPLFSFDLRGKAVYTSLSPWVKTLYEEFIQGQRIPFVPCPFPIDTKTFEPKPVEKNIDVLIYFKGRDNKFVDKLQDMLSIYPINIQLIKCGKYEESHYIDLLNRSKLCLWVGRHESQGFAFQECLSMNVPILCYDVQTMYEEYISKGDTQFCCFEKHRGEKNLVATSATSWSQKCGEKTHNINEIPELIIKMLDSLDSYEPREFVLENLSSEACWNRLKNALNI
jgi:hypothetical protein